MLHGIAIQEKDNGRTRRAALYRQQRLLHPIWTPLTVLWATFGVTSHELLEPNQYINAHVFSWTSVASKLEINEKKNDWISLDWTSRKCQTTAITTDLALLGQPNKQLANFTGSFFHISPTPQKFHKQRFISFPLKYSSPGQKWNSADESNFVAFLRRNRGPSAP